MVARGGTNHPNGRIRHEWQLVFFTILTQMSVGIFVSGGLAILLFPGWYSFAGPGYLQVFFTIALTCLVLGTGSAGMHLGRPLNARFSFTNVRTSWLSREALFGGFFGIVNFCLLLRQFYGAEFSIFDGVLILLGMTSGLGLVAVISKLYMLRTVPAWNNWGTPGTFFTTTFLLGLVLTTGIQTGSIFWDEIYAVNMMPPDVFQVSIMLIIILAGIQTGIYLITILSLKGQRGIAAESSRLVWTGLRPILAGRFLTLWSGAGILIGSLGLELSLLIIILGFGLIVVSEVLGRYLFYGFYRREGF